MKITIGRLRSLIHESITQAKLDVAGSADAPGALGVSPFPVELDDVEGELTFDENDPNDYPPPDDDVMAVN